MKVKCCFCGRSIKEKFKIKLRGDKEYDFCSTHFNMFEGRPLKEIREKVTKSRKCLT